ncbi:MAG: carbon-nitrogen hydrolase family protein [Burkholderiaceae bacterium]|nr:carbon-nitrogen hydrolase family protein [Burkholderiaceae bacterium]MDO9089649.1 carbon-nitrogen hydrolase family protein [Burkholderiaceae bacterium]MDP1967915.1 carbon-nitrogen hydrolase family protein [Burkholderiaceae bacterium]
MQLQIACIQLNPGNDLDANLQAARAAVMDAVAQGAQLVALPEFAAFLDRSGRAMAQAALPEESHPAVAFFQELARSASVWIMLGSVAVRESVGGERLCNRSFAIAPDGRVVARYDKIHMFDVVLPSGRAIQESRTYRPGTQAPVVDTPWGALGMTICYDLRFPQLYRALAQGGATILMVPSAFAFETGSVHWQPLLQARAIETGCFVVAAATCGTHPGEWRTWGHSMVVDPWGRILAQAGDQPGVLMATLDLPAVPRARAAIPSLDARNKFDIVRAPGVA